MASDPLGLEMNAQIEELAPPALVQPGRWLLQSGAITIGASLLIQTLNAASGILIARGLGPVGRGQLSAALLWVGIIAAVAALGLPEAAAYLSALPGADRRLVAGTVAALALALSLAAILVGLALTPSLLDRYGVEAAEAGRLYLAWIPLTLVVLAYLAILQGALAVASYNLLRVFVIATTVLMLGAILASGSGLSVSGVIWVYLVANGLTLIATAGVVARHRCLGATVKLHLVRPLLSYGVRMHCGNVVAIVAERLDQILISLLLPAADLGVYVVALTFAAGVGLVGSSLGPLVLPAIAAAGASASTRRFELAVRAAVYLSVMAALVIGLCAPILIPHIFGALFVRASAVVPPLVVATAASSSNRVLSAALAGSGHPLAPALARAAGVAVTIPLLVLLLGSGGVTWAGFALLAGHGVTFALMAAFASQRCGVRVRSLLLPARSDAVLLREFEWRGQARK